MGFIRSGIVFILAIALFLGLFVGNLFLTLNWSLDYNHVSPYIQNISNDLAQSSGAKAIILQEYNSKNSLCNSQNKTSLNFSFNEEEIIVPCEEVNNGAKSVIEYVINESVPLYYYKNYNCSLIDCVQKENQPLALVSQNAKDYWGKQFYSVIILCLIAFGLLFIFVKEKHNAFVLAGIMTIFSAIPFRQITWILSLLPDLLPFKIIPIFFTEAGSVFTFMLILGIILISLGIGIKFFDWGMKLDGLIRKTFKRKDKEKKIEKEEEIKTEEINEIVEKKVKEELNKKEKTKKKNKKN